MSHSEVRSTLLRQQQVLARFGEMALRSENLDEILHEACRLVGEALGTDLSKVMELQEDRITLKVRAGVGWQPGVVGEVTVRAEKDSSEGYALQTGQPVVSPDITKEDRFKYPGFVREAGVHALANVIIIGPDSQPPYGLLQVDSRVPREFNENDTEFLRSYANLLAAAVERLRVAAEARNQSALLRDSEARLRTLLETLPQLVWSAREQEEWTWVGPQWCAYTGLSAENSLGHGWLDALHPDDRAAARAAWRNTEAEGRLQLDFRIRHGASGRYHWFQTRGTPIRDEEGRVTEWIATSTDIDDQVQAREVLARSSAQLEALVAERTAELQQALHSLHQQVTERERAEERLRQGEKLKAIGQLSGGIAHDVNNVLQSITNGLELIRLRTRRDPAADITRYLDLMDKATKRAANLTHRMLAFARQQTLSPKPVDLDQIARGMEEMIRRAVGPAVQVELKLADGNWLVLCDPNQMESAILNLCINARDSMPQGGWLTISTAEVVLTQADIPAHDEAAPGRYVAIAVSDTGTGMSPEVLARVFEPFFTTKPLGEGTGLGLSQIYGFVRQSGGLAQIETAPGRGTTVRLCLPFHEHVEKGEHPTGPAPDKTLLLVEDEPDVRELLAETLRDEGFRVLEADGSAAALRLVQAGTQLDLMITDVGLPGGMNGRQLADAVLERRPSLPVIIITGYAGGEQFPGMDVVRKPFEPSVLTELVRTKLAAGSGAEHQRTA